MIQERINIAKLLKDCPKGMELDCAMYDDVYFDYVDNFKIIHCYIQNEGFKTSITFNQHGTPNSDIKSKCVIFPKGKNTWKEFVPPFKNGDIVATKTGAWIGITTGGESGKSMPVYCVIKGDNTFEAYLDVKASWSFSRLATEEEKTKLFQAIKNDGYRWDPETKTLEELAKLNFKAGDWITNGNYIWKIISIDNFDYTLQNQLGEFVEDTIDYVNKTFHLWTIQDAKDGDVIFYDNGWTCILKNIHGIWYSSYCFITSDGEFHMGYNEHAINATINGNAHPATKEQCNLLFQKIKEAGYKWCDETKILVKLIEPKFKVGDTVRNKSNHNITFTITSIEEDSYVCGAKPAFWFNAQDCYELVPNKIVEPKFKVGDEIRHKTTNKTFIITHKDNLSYYVNSNHFAIWIEDQDNWELVSNKSVKPKFKVGDRVRHKDDRTILAITGIKSDCYFMRFYNMRRHDYQNEKVLFKNQDQYELASNKFDINTLVPFESRVLVRDYNKDAWKVSFWGCLIDNEHGFKYDTIRGSYKQCIPYEGNEHLLGKTDSCNEFYKTW